jgi:hypothetical protein
MENPPALIVDAYSSAVGNEVFYSLDPDIRTQQKMSLEPGNLLFTAHNIEKVIDFIASNYHPETRIGSTQIYRLNP